MTTSSCPDIDKTYLYAKNTYKAKYQPLINKRESTRLKYCKYFIEYLNAMYDIYKNIEEYNSSKERKILIRFGNMIVYMVSNKKLNPVVIEIEVESLTFILFFLCNPVFFLCQKILD